MKVQEMAARKGPTAKSYALSISTAPRSEAEFLAEWPHIGAALTQWRARRKTEAETFMLTVVSDPSLHTRFEELIQTIYTQEATLSALLKSLTVRIALLKPNGQEGREYQLGSH